MKEGVLTLQNFSNKHTAELENVQGKRKNKKIKFSGCEANTN